MEEILRYMTGRSMEDKISFLLAVTEKYFAKYTLHIWCNLHIFSYLSHTKS